MVTNLTPFNQLETTIKGSLGEQEVKRRLVENGWYVIPSYAYTGPGEDKAPRMEGMNAYFVIPDLDTCKAGTRRWVEVKTKERADFTRITQRFEHGIPLRHYHHYFEVQRATGCPVWLFVYETGTKTLLYASLNALNYEVRIYNGDKMSRGGMAFFPKDSFTDWAKDSYLFIRTEPAPTPCP